MQIKTVTSSRNTNTERKRISKTARQTCNAIDSVLSDINSFLSSLNSQVEKESLVMTHCINTMSIADTSALAKKIGDNYISDLLGSAMHKHAGIASLFKNRCWNERTVDNMTELLNRASFGILQVMELLINAKNDITAEYLNE